MVELVDTSDLGSDGRSPWRFESSYPHLDLLHKKWTRYYLLTRPFFVLMVIVRFLEFYGT